MVKKMNNLEMVNAVNSLTEFVGKDKIVPVALSVAISANIKNLLRELEPYNEEREKLIKKAADNESFIELCNIDVEVNLRTVSAELLDGVELSTKDYFALEFMLEEPKSQSE